MNAVVRSEEEMQYLEDRVEFLEKLVHEQEEHLKALTVLLKDLQDTVKILSNRD